MFKFDKSHQANFHDIVDLLLKEQSSFVFSNTIKDLFRVVSSFLDTQLFV